MCLAVPMKLVEIDGDRAGLAELDGVRRPVDLSLVSDPRLGDYVIVHAGFAIETLDPREAEERLALFAELAAALDDPSAAATDSRPRLHAPS